MIKADWVLSHLPTARVVTQIEREESFVHSVEPAPSSDPLLDSYSGFRMAWEW